jgi:hypothetical protein
MSYGLNPRKLAVMALGAILAAAPVFAARPGQQDTSVQAKGDQAKSGQAKPDQTTPDEATEDGATKDRATKDQPPQTPNATEAAGAPATNSSSAAKASDPIIVPAGTHFPLVLHNGISTRDAQPGTQVYLETTFPVVVNDRVVIPVGSYAQGEITEAKRPGKGKGGAEVRMRLTTLILPNGYTVKLDGVPTNADNGNGAYASKEGGQINKDRDKGADAGTVITTTGAGAGIGAVAGGARGAGIGAGIGAAAGLAAVMMARGPDLELPRGSTVDIVLDRPIYLDPAKINFSEPGRATALPAPPPRPPARTRLPF